MQVLIENNREICIENSGKYQLSSGWEIDWL